jgi:hypothetical protein
MLDDSSKATSPKPDKTQLYLPGSATSATNRTVAGVPVGGNSAIPSRPKIRLSLALVMLSLVAVTALVLGVLFAVVPLLAQPKHNNIAATASKPTLTSATTAQPTQAVPHVVATPAATQIPTQTPVVQGTATIDGLTAIPNHFAVQSDCQVDNGYRCTVTLYGQNKEDTIHWKASSKNIATKFSPASGKLKAGDQQQVIVYIYNACPYNGTLIFTVDNEHITLPVMC